MTIKDKDNADDPSSKWGFTNDPTGEEGVDTVISTFNSSVEQIFSNPNKKKFEVGGPDYGVLNREYNNPFDEPNEPYFSDYIEITVQISGIDSAMSDKWWEKFIKNIDKQDIVVAFGPPNASNAAVPEPATVLLLGSGLIGLACLGRKKFFPALSHRIRSPKPLCIIVTGY